MADIDFFNEFKVTRIYWQDSFMVRTLIRVKKSITSLLYLFIGLRIHPFYLFGKVVKFENEVLSF